MTTTTWPPRTPSPALPVDKETLISISRLIVPQVLAREGWADTKVVFSLTNAGRGRTARRYHYDRRSGDYTPYFKITVPWSHSATRRNWIYALHYLLHELAHVVDFLEHKGFSGHNDTYRDIEERLYGYYGITISRRVHSPYVQSLSWQGRLVYDWDHEDMVKAPTLDEFQGALPLLVTGIHDVKSLSKATGLDAKSVRRWLRAHNVKRLNGHYAWEPNDPNYQFIVDSLTRKGGK